MNFNNYVHIVKCVIINPKSFRFYKHFISIEEIIDDIKSLSIELEYLIDIIKINVEFIINLVKFYIL